MKKSKKEIAEILKNAGFFSKYRYIEDIIKDFNYNSLNTYYREYKADINYYRN